MSNRNWFFGKRIQRLIFTVLLPVAGMAGTKTWTGYGGDGYWSNPLNWSAISLPLPTDDVLLDNGDLPVSYQVVLPDMAVVLKKIRISPSPGRNIELILPSSNKINNALSVTGPGYGIELGAGAIFRNASGISSGESLSIMDSMMIHDGGRYVHQTRAAHANGILNILSTASGTEQGIFDFDVPRASYTISVSNRIYGSLELHSTAQGSAVNYTCTGANSLLVRGNLRIGNAVSVSMNLSGTNGNIQVEGDFIQEGGQFNLASGTNSQTVFRVRGDLYQSSSAIITETNNGTPFIELNGSRIQQTAMGGQIINQVGFRINNPEGTALRLPLTLPWMLELRKGPLFSTGGSLLTLDTRCDILVDSTNQTSAFVQGPLCKTGLVGSDHFIFPVGSAGNIRWLELKNATGSYTVEYIRENPSSLGSTATTPLDHISKIEYWTVLARGATGNTAKIELSFSSALSGGVTDPAFLHVAKFQSGEWQDGGHSGVTGNYLAGSVLSGGTDFTASQYTLASTANLENPLPLTLIDLRIKEISGSTLFFWTVTGNEAPDHFDLFEIADGTELPIQKVKADHLKKDYSWSENQSLRPGKHFFKIRMTDTNGQDYDGKIVEYTKVEEKKKGGIVVFNAGGNERIFIQTAQTGPCSYEVYAMDGRLIQKGFMEMLSGINPVSWKTAYLPCGFYVLRLVNDKGQIQSIQFKY